MSLNELAIMYSLDKHVLYCHNYINSYNELFTNVKNTVKNVLEIGIGSVENNQMQHVCNKGYKTGNSLRCWRDYFLNANIYGIDIFNCNINEERIKTFVANQANIFELSQVIEEINDSLDIIIDDGSHNHQHQIISFMFLEKYLKKEVFMLLKIYNLQM